MRQLFNQEILYGIYSKTYLYIILLLVSLFVIVSYVNYSAVMNTYNDFQRTEKFYQENDLNIEEDLAGEHDVENQGDLEVITNPIHYHKEMVSQFIYTASPKYALTQFLESAFLYFPIVFGTIGLLIAVVDLKYKTIKLKTVRENKKKFGLAKQVSLLTSGLFILMMSLIIAYLINYLFYVRITNAIPISEFQLSLSNIESSSSLFLKFIFAYAVSVLFMNIGYTLGILFKNIYLGMILIVVYTFVIPSSYTVLGIKNSLHYIGVRLFDFHGVLAIDYPKDGTTLITSILVLLCATIIPFIINMIIVNKRSSFET